MKQSRKVVAGPLAPFAEGFATVLAGRATSR